MVLLRDADLGEAQLVGGPLRPAAPSLLRNLECEMVIYTQFPKKNIFIFPYRYVRQAGEVVLELLHSCRGCKIGREK